MTSRSDRSLQKVALCALLPKQATETKHLFGAHAKISDEKECELVFSNSLIIHLVKQRKSEP